MPEEIGPPLRIGSKWRHIKSGGTYIIVAPIAYLESTEEPLVVYRCLKTHRVWARPLSEFTDGRFEAVEKGGKK